MVATYSFIYFMTAISFLKNTCRTLALMTIPKHGVVSITSPFWNRGPAARQNLFDSREFESFMK
jgi:hypothetical protein